MNNTFLKIISILFVITCIVFSQESLIQDILLLQTGKFHGKDVNANSDEEWVGLFRTDDGFELRKSIITIAPFNDKMLDKPSEKTGKEVSVNFENEPLFLVKGLENIVEGPVVTLFGGRKFIYPGESWRFKLGEKKFYTLSAFGEAIDSGINGERIDKSIENYSVKMSRIPWRKSQVVFNFERLDADNLPQFYWVGDLDRDGELDFYIDLANHYAFNRFTLFLSSKAKPGLFVKKVASFQKSGC